ncbi:phosphomannomutase [Caldichromatium japonicum]|uniref:Phosphomannomutase n=2 Tax=Caldichromatium japonicum TaxID=2699430 RepID=A0A6G7VGX5_9GAMM|nr:phosphomannomutase [Caldichromatium japonicum]QIK39150.1 phosphomannomutase [Caldichromatium japonicum]
MQISDLMRQSGVGFGTSGARGLVSQMTDWVCYAYTRGFLSYLTEIGAFAGGMAVGIGGDLRPSTPRIMTACARAIADAGGQPVNLGLIPSPAVALYGFQRRIPTLMVTGSHIPDDRNGIKFNRPESEVLKRDEEGIRVQWIDQPAGLFGADGVFTSDQSGYLTEESDAARELYFARYLGFFPAGPLQGLRIGVYEHSSVARELLSELLSRLGAEVVRLGRSATFVPVDTEAIRLEDQELARRWVPEYRLATLVSTDGDGDRPLIADEQGHWLRGDILGVLCARALGIQAVATPVSSNTVVERYGAFTRVLRTRIGSPFVIEGMGSLLDGGFAPVAGYEANGGFLLASALEHEGRRLDALPTRDAVLPILVLLAESKRRGLRLSELTGELPPRFTASSRLKDFPTELSQAHLAALQQNPARIESEFGADFGLLAGLETTDGLRMIFKNGEILHLRPSGNAPELRVYTEADTSARAEAMVKIALAHLERWRS